jgi:hypothetical protein
MANAPGERFLPFVMQGKVVQTRTAEEMRKLILGSDEVKDVIAQTVRERTEKYK